MSRPKKGERPVLVKHRHCLVCGLPIPMEKSFCGEKCEGEYRRLERRRRYMFIATLLLFPLLILIFTLLRAIFPS